MPKKRRFLSALLLLVVAITAIWLIAKISGCSGTPEGFQTQVTKLEPADLLAGAWEGTWKSSNKPLGGKLAAIIEKKDDGSYHASYTSQTPIGEDKSICIYQVAERENTTWTFHGKRDMGFLKGGTYTYSGTVTPDSFTCTYDSTFDKGTFKMQRKPTTPPQN